MELRDIEIFLTLAEELHFGRTAERLHVSQARVSQAIGRQERRLGGALFDRANRRRITLTPLGRQLRDDLLPSYAGLRDGLERARWTARGTTGPLRVGYSTPWCADLVLAAAGEFRDRYPDCAVNVREVGFEDLFGPLRGGELELHVGEFATRAPGVIPGPLLLRERRSLLVPADHPLAGREFVELEDLADLQLIMPAGRVPQALLEQHLPERTPMGRPIPRGPSYTSWHEVPVLVAAGLGVSIVAARAARYHGRPGVRFVPIRDATTLDYGVLWPAGEPAPPALAFVDLLRGAAERYQAADGG